MDQGLFVAQPTSLLACFQSNIKRRLLCLWQQTPTMPVSLCKSFLATSKVSLIQALCSITSVYMTWIWPWAPLKKK